jgi:hypothetical protein
MDHRTIGGTESMDQRKRGGRETMDHRRIGGQKPLSTEYEEDRNQSPKDKYANLFYSGGTS